MLEDRLRKWNEDNLKYSKELKVAALTAQRKSNESQSQKKAVSTTKENVESGKDPTVATSSRSQKRGRDTEQDKVFSYKLTTGY